MNAIVVRIASGVSGLFLALGVALFPIWLAIAWISIKIRLNVTADAEPEVGRFLLVIVAPYLLVLAILFIGWRALSRANNELNGKDWSDR